MTPSTPSPAGVAPLRWTITSRPSCSSRQAKLWWFSTPASVVAPSASATRRWITAWFAAAYSPISSIAAQYSAPASEARSSHARCRSSFGSSGWSASASLQ
jgi:hypothetical protein